MAGWCFGPAAFAVLLTAVPAAAQTADEGEDASICVAIASHWSPTLAESARILSEPVAPSFRRKMAEGGCGRFSLVKEDLLTAQVNFGDQRGAAAALRYLEAELLADVPAPERLAAHLKQAWHTALPDIRRIERAPGASHDRRSALRKSPTVARFRLLAETPYQLGEVVRFHLRAAEEFRSMAFLARAEFLVATLAASEDFLTTIGAERADALGLDRHPATVEALRRRLAVLRSDLTRSPADMAAARVLVAAGERPGDTLLAERAFSGGDNFCEISSGWSGAAELQAECERDHGAQERVTAFWVDRGLLDLIEDVPLDQPAGERGPGNGAETALRLLEAERAPGRSQRCCWASPTEEMIRLLQARAAAYLRVPGSDDFSRRQHALDDLAAAERLVPAASSPARFARIARNWLQVWQDGAAGNRRDPPGRARYAAYLRLLLGGIDAIVAGAKPARSQ